MNVEAHITEKASGITSGPDAVAGAVKTRAVMGATADTVAATVTAVSGPHLARPLAVGLYMGLLGLYLGGLIV